MAASSSQIIIVPRPAAGADWAYTVPAGYGLLPFFVICVSALLTDSGSAGNRQPTLQILDRPGGVPIGTFGINAALIVSQSARYVWGSGLPAAAAPVNSTSSPSTFPLPQGLIVPGGGVVQVVTTGLLAGDQWSDIVLTLGS